MELPPAWQRPDPLRGLEDLPWSVLAHGAGVDDLLRRAVHGERVTREVACQALADRLLVDDTVSEATRLRRALPGGAGRELPGARGQSAIG